MPTLYVLGGKQNRHVLKNNDEWNLYDGAVVLGIDTDTGAVTKCFEYQSPREAKANDNSSVLFKSGTLVEDRLYACTSTEVLVFKLPEFQVLHYVSLPCFNDLHHVIPGRDGSLLTVSTGLDMVVRFSPQGKVLEEWNVLGPESPWVRFSRRTDYRKVASTKPHESHPNFVSERNGEVWATRMRQRDAVCLSDRRKRVDISVEYPHDGLVCFDKIFFTLVDGRIAIADLATLQVEQIIDLKTMDDPNALLGWCRGILPLSLSRWWVGFSRVRKTHFVENILWVKRVLKEGMLEEPTHVALYDAASRQCLQKIDVEKHGMNVVFSILAAT
jgi:hypothetical protein